MRIVATLVLIWMCVTCEASTEVMIGGIFPGDDPNLPSTMETAFTLAVEIINNSTKILPNTTIKYLINRTSSSDVFDAVRTVCYQASMGVATIIGPISSSAIRLTGAISSRLGIPEISYAATDPFLFKNSHRFHSLIHMSSSDDLQSKALISLIEHFKWDSLAIITSTTDYGMNGLMEFKRLAITKHITLSTVQQFKVYSNLTQIDVTNQLKAIRQTHVRIVVLNCIAKYGKIVLEKARELDMLGREWVWIATDGITSVDGIYSSTKAPYHLQGLLGTRPSISTTRDNVLYSQFIYHWDKMGRNPEELEAYAYLVFDSVLAFAYGLDEYLSDGHVLSTRSLNCLSCGITATEKWSDGELLLNYIKKVDKSGISGRIRFTNEGSPIDSKYDIVNLHKTGYAKIGSWESSNGLVFSNYGSLFWMGGKKITPPASSIDITNKTFRVVVAFESPFIMLKSNNTGKLEFEGYAIDLLHEIQKRLGFHINIHISYDGHFGIRDPETNQWNGMMKELIENTADVAVAPLTLTAERQQVIQFSKPFMDTGLTIVMQKPSENKSLLSFMDPYTNSVWLLILLSTLGVGCVLYFCNKLSPYGYYGRFVQANSNDKGVSEMNKREEEKETFQLRESIWFSVGSILGQGTDVMPRSSSGRIVTAAWWFTGTIFVTNYTANLASFLTVSSTTHAIESLEDLTKQDKILYGTTNPSLMGQFIETSNIPMYMRAWKHSVTYNTHVKNKKEGIARVESDEHYAFIYDAPSLEYIVGFEPCNKRIINDVFFKQGYGLGFPMNSPYVQQFSDTIVKLREASYFELLHEKWFEMRSKCVSSSAGIVQLDADHSAGIFTLLCGGIVASFIFLMVEWIVAAHNELKMSKNKDLKSLNDALRARLRRICTDIRTNWFVWRHTVNDACVNRA